MNIYITEGINQPSKKGTTSMRRKPLTLSKWLEFYNADSFYSTPPGTRLSLVLNEDDFGYKTTNKNKLQVSVSCDIKFNELNDLKVSLQGITREHELIFEDIWKACWLGLFKEFNFNPLMSLIKPHARIWVKDEYEYMTKSLTNHVTLELNTKKEMGFSFKELNAVLLAEKYLRYVDFFKGNEPVKWLAVEGIFTDWKHYQNFETYVVNETTRKKAHWEIAKKRERTTKTYLQRSRELGILTKVGTGNRGGNLTKKGREILEKYVLYTEQDKRVLESVKYEVRK